MIPKPTLSRDARKLMEIERLFKKQEEEERRRLNKKKKLCPPDDLNPILGEKIEELMGKSVEELFEKHSGNRLKKNADSFTERKRECLEPSPASISLTSPVLSVTTPAQQNSQVFSSPGVMTFASSKSAESEKASDTGETKEEGAELKFVTREEFMKNFGKEDWLYAYQMAEIVRNSVDAGKMADELGRTNEKNVMKDNMEFTKMAQQKEEENEAAWSMPEECLKRLKEAVERTKTLAKTCGELAKIGKGSKELYEEKRLLLKQRGLVEIITQFNDQKERVLKKFKI